MGLVARKPVFGVSDKVRLKPVPTATETSQKIEISLAASLNLCIPKANNKGADQTARMRRLVCVFIVHKSSKTGFLALRAICKRGLHYLDVLYIV